MCEKGQNVNNNTPRLIDRPLEPWELQALDTDCTGVCQIDCLVMVPLDTLFEGIEATNDFVSEAITGTVCLQDISYVPMNANPSEGVLIEVGGYILAEDIPRDTNDDIKTTAATKLRNTTLSHLMDIESISDSMLVDTETKVISLTGNVDDTHGNTHRISVGIEVAGEVDVVYRKKHYKNPSEFPHALTHLIRASKGTCLFDGSRPEIGCLANNWFEYVVTIDGEMFDDPEVADIDFTALSPEEVADDLEDRALRAMGAWQNTQKA